MPIFSQNSSATCLVIASVGTHLPSLRSPPVVLDHYPAGQRMNLKLPPIHFPAAICSVVIWKVKEEINFGFLLIQGGAIERVQVGAPFAKTNIF